SHLGLGRGLPDLLLVVRADVVEAPDAECLHAPAALPHPQHRARAVVLLKDVERLLHAVAAQCLETRFLAEPLDARPRPAETLLEPAVAPIRLDDVAERVPVLLRAAVMMAARGNGAARELHDEG